MLAVSILLSICVVFEGGEFELNTMVVSNAIQDHPHTLSIYPKIN